MSSTLPVRRSIVLYSIGVAVTVAVLLATVLANVASAHGSVVDPASRSYGCFERWGSNHQAPQMATEDPMCYQAWQADPNAMWNWNGLFREGVAGNHQGAIPDGQLCSGGRTQSGRYNAMDAVGDWKAKSIGNNFSVRLFDGARHGADYIRVYVTKQGYNPITQPLGWGNLELVGQIGNTPQAQWEQHSDGVSINVGGNAPGRTGRHIVYTVWQASHLDQSYYFCSDVNFGGSSPSPSPSASRSASPSPSASVSRSPSASPSRSASASPSVSNPPATCTATYTVVNQWSGGFQADVKVTAGSVPLQGWHVMLYFPGTQAVTQAWSATVTSTGGVVMADNVSYNGNLAAGASATFGMLVSGSASPPPTVSCSRSM
jgi:lytic cellulose monooxygenase (C4-dehydrogenating)